MEIKPSDIQCLHVFLCEDGCSRVKIGKDEWKKHPQQTFLMDKLKTPPPLHVGSHTSPDIYPMVDFSTGLKCPPDNLIVFLPVRQKHVWRERRSVCLDAFQVVPLASSVFLFYTHECPAHDASTITWDVGKGLVNVHPQHLEYLFLHLCIFVHIQHRQILYIVELWYRRNPNPTGHSQTNAILWIWNGAATDQCCSKESGKKWQL